MTHKISAAQPKHQAGQSNVAAEGQAKVGIYLQDNRPASKWQAQMKRSLAHPSKQAQAPQSQVALQRRELRFKPKGNPGTNLGTLRTMSQRVDTETGQAFTYVRNKLMRSADQNDDYGLTVNDFTASSGQRFAAWVRALNGHNNNLKAAATGYMIEDIVTGALNGQIGYSSQVVVDGARPDFEIFDGNRYGVVDITAENSAGHIYNKNFRWSLYDYISESIYPSFDFSNIGNTQVDITGDTADIIRQARIQLANRKIATELGLLQLDLHVLINSNRFKSKKIKRDADLAHKSVTRYNRGRLSRGGINAINTRVSTLNQRIKKYNKANQTVRNNPNRNGSNSGRWSSRLRSQQILVSNKYQVRKVKSLASRIVDVALKYNLSGLPPRWR